jgi:nickel/cobalt transporter (NicO) family protein
MMRLAAGMMAIAICVAVVWSSTPVRAQTETLKPSSPTQGSSPITSSKSFLPPKTSAEKDGMQPPSGPLAGLYMWLATQQRQFTTTLAASLRDIKQGNVFVASLVLIGFSFAYGVLHAAGPGHGKAIVSSYMLADGQALRRGIQLAFLSSLVQALSAIIVFSIIVLALQGTRPLIVSTEAWLERASWAGSYSGSCER